LCSRAPLTMIESEGMVKKPPDNILPQIEIETQVLNNELLFYTCDKYPNYSAYQPLYLM